MQGQKIIFNARGMSLTEGMKEYMVDKLQKLNNIDTAISISCEMGKTVSNKKADKDFYVRVLVSLPKATIRVKKEGEEAYAIMDELVESLQKMINRYVDDKRKWEGTEPWNKFEPIPDIDAPEEIEATQYATYQPRVRRKDIDVTLPLTLEEAIHHMEFSGRNFYLYKSRETGKLSVVYKEGVNAEYTVLVPTE